MNKTTGITLVAAALALAYPASSWVLGRQVQSALDEQYKSVETQPYLRIVQRDYQRGIFSSTETVTIGLSKALAESLRGEGAEAAAGEDDLRLTIRTEIHHGPFPGMATLAAATADSELVLDEETKRELAQVLGEGKAPLQLHTVYRFDGGGKAVLTSPAFDATVPAGEGDKPVRFAFEGLTLNVDFAPQLAHYTLDGTMPRLEIQEEDKRITLVGLRLEGRQERMFEDELLYSGTQKLSVAELSLTGMGGEDESDAQPVVMKQVAYDVDMPRNGDFLDLSVRTGAEVVQIGERNFGPAHYDLSVNHLHGRTMAKLHRAFMNVYSDPAALKAAEEDAEALLAPLSGPAMELLAYNPEISLDRLSFTSPHGEARISARVKLKDVTQEDLAMPFMLVSKLEAGGDISVPEGLITDLQAASGDSEEEARMKTEMFRQQVAAFAEQGYVKLDGGLIMSNLAFAGGELTVNGKPFNPFAMDTSAAADSEMADLEGLDLEGEELEDEEMKAE